MQFDLGLFGQQLRDIFNPAVDLGLVAASAGLLALTSPRNVHLSDRARATLSEALYDVPKSSLSADQKKTRTASLEDQNKLFVARYKEMSRAFKMLVVCMYGFGFSAALSSTPFQNGTGAHFSGPTTYLFWEISGGSAAVFSFYLAWALAILREEFKLGPVTLDKNSKDFKLAIERAGDESKALKPLESNVTTRLAPHQPNIILLALSTTLAVVSVLLFAKLNRITETESAGN